MKRTLSVFLLAIAVALLAQTAQAAPGRLNFMLINLTNQDITDVRICPTYYPQYMSENLLKTPLDPDTRIYIGPNYYGDQRYWTIILTWADGYEHAFTHTRLTRYNTYVVYPSPTGVRMRQSYETAFARPGVYAPSYAVGAGDRYVAVGVPEKVNVARQPVALADNTRLATHNRRTRDLVFDDDDAAPALEGTAANDINADKIAMKTTVELTRGGKTTTVLPTEDFKSGDKARLIFSTNTDGHIYWLSKGTSGQYQVLYPTPKTGMDNSVAKNREYTVPARGAWRFDDNKGTETLVAVLAPNPVPELDRAVKLAADGKKDEASSIVSQIVNKHEQKRTTRDLVFEEEDDGDVNTKSQKANGDEPFVATWELSHS